MGVKRTHERIKYSFTWPTIQSDCKSYVESCHVCQVKKQGDLIRTECQ